MPKKHGQAEHKPMYPLVLLVVIIAVIALFAAGSYIMQNAIRDQPTNGGQPMNGYNASLHVTLTAPAYSVESFMLTLSGNGENESLYLKLGPEAYLQNSNSINGISTASGPITINSSTQLNNTIIIPENSTSVFFAGLLPYSNYTLTINGSESPYCFPTLECPMFILRLFKKYKIETGSQSSLTNFTASLAPSMQYQNTTHAESCNVLPLLYNQSSYVKCYDNTRLLNFELIKVNPNMTITGYAYPYYPLQTNITVKPQEETFTVGEAVSFECSGYIAYLSSSNYTGQYAIFKLIKTKPIPCPARV